MLLADLGRAGLTAMIPVSVALGGPTMAVILLVAAPLSILRTFFLAGYTSSLPALVGRSEVGRANSVFETIYSIGYIVGPSMAGVLAATIGPGPTLAIDAVSFAISALGLAFVRRDLRAPARPAAAAARRRDPRRNRLHRSNPTLRSAVLFWGATSVVMAPLVTAVTVYVTKELAYAPSALGLILTAYGVGTVAGAITSARVVGRTRPAPVMLGGNLVMGLALASFALNSQLAVLLVAAVVAGTTQSLVLVTYLTLRTAESPDALLGRIGSTARTISLGLQPIGLLVGWRARRRHERVADDHRHGHRRGRRQPAVPSGCVLPAGKARDPLNSASGLTGSGRERELGHDLIRREVDAHAAVGAVDSPAAGFRPCLDERGRARAPRTFDVDHRGYLLVHALVHAQTFGPGFDS